MVVLTFKKKSKRTGQSNQQRKKNSEKEDYQRDSTDLLIPLVFGSTRSLKFIRPPFMNFFAASSKPEALALSARDFLLAGLNGENW